MKRGPSRSPEIQKDPSRRRFLRIGLVLGAVAVEEATLGIGRRLLKVGREGTSSDLVEVKRYRFEVDGFIVESNSVSPEEFRLAYEKAKKLIGGRFWQPKKLSIEYGNVAQEHFGNTAITQHPDTRAEVSFTNESLDEITANPESLSHELVHFLLGPESKKWPDLLQEIIASVADESETRFPYDALDREWIQMPIAKSMYSGSPLTSTRYAAIEHIGQRYADKVPGIVQAAFSRPDLNFDDLAQFLGEFGIKHHILTPGRSGEFFGVTPYKDPQKSGYVYVRYKREAGQGDEFGWTGPVRAIFTDENGQTYVGEPLSMEGLIFIGPPMIANKLVEVTIQHPDGEVKYRL